jgi:hypothetical protein
MAIAVSLWAAAAGPAAVQPAAAADPAGGHEYAIPRTDLAIRVDGVVDEPAWETALRLELAYEIDPGGNTPARVRTEVFLTYDDRALHVAFRAHDPEPGSIQARLTDRDGAFRDDFVGVALDPFNDGRRGFMLLVNPLGVQMDLARNDVGPADLREDPSWDAIWHAAGRLDGAGYEVEMTVPFTSLRFPRAPGEQTWGLQAIRNHPRDLRRQYGLVPHDKDRDCFFCQAARITGLQGIAPGLSLELDPTVTVGRTDRRETFPAGPLVRGDVEADPGMSARWSMTPNLVLNAAINPDFSQVEADAAQLDVNTRFTLFFPEKRPFFMEAADVFATPLNIVFTRTVVDPAWGIKLSGKEGRHALGVAVGRDQKTALIFPSNQASEDATFDRKHHVGVLRYRADVGSRSTLGLLATGREGDEYANSVYGVDAHLGLTGADTIRIQALRSSTRYPADVAADFGQPAERFADEALLLRYIHASRDWFVFGGYEEIGPGFRADTGFLPRVDTRRAETALERHIWAKPGARYSRLMLGTWNWWIEDHDGRLTDRSLGVHGLFLGPRQSFLYARAARELEFFDGTEYHKTVGNFDFNIQPTGDLVLLLRGRLGDAVDYANSRPGRLLNLAPAVNVSLGRRLHVQLDHTLERLHVDGGRLYEANLTQLRAVYQLSLRSFARAIVQFQDLERDPSLYTFAVEPDSRNTLTQLLFSYKVNPQTLVFVGYSETRSDAGADRLLQEHRTYFLKIGYAWVP